MQCTYFLICLAFIDDRIAFNAFGAVGIPTIIYIYQLILIFYVILFCFVLYRRVLSVSSKLSVAGEMAQIINVLLLPPRALERMRVREESRNGMCITCAWGPFWLLLFLSTSASAFMHWPSTVSERFILLASCIRSPVAYVLLVFSLPARSTRFITLNFSVITSIKN